MGHIQQDIHGHHTSEKDMAYESLTKWNLFNRQKPKKIETLKQALRKTDIDHLLRDIDEILEDYQKKVPQKPSGECCLNDCQMLETVRQKRKG